MRRVVRGAAATVAVSLLAAPRPLPAAPRVAPPARPSPGLPVAAVTLPRIRVSVARDHVVVEEDLVLGPAATGAGDLDLYVAFGAPGLPRAIDARLASVREDGEELPGAAAGEEVPADRAYVRPGGARLLLGSPRMAGAVFHLHAATLHRATAPTSLARLRVRSLLDLPPVDPSGGREIVVRLGSLAAEPYALETIEVVSDDARPWVSSASARLCGPDADPSPLAVVLRRPLQGAAVAGGAADTVVAPSLAVRHASDALCLRVSTAAP